MTWDEIWALIVEVFPDGMSDLQFRLVVEAIDVIFTELQKE